jgi:hypothetical protein
MTFIGSWSPKPAAGDREYGPWRRLRGSCSHVFNRKDYDLATAEPPTFALLAHDGIDAGGEIMLP